ncbi:unnamed protein product [Sphagnum tenellum]
MGNKLGVNPKANHHDTPGIYFYYNYWLLSSEDVSDGQYATHFEHYWICNIEKTKDCIDFGNFNAGKAAGIARRNGWYEEMEKVLADPALKNWLKQPKILKTAAGKFWAAMDYIANELKTFSWLQMLKGVDAIFDPGKGIINSDEPAQVVVLNKSLIKVIDHGENRNDEDKTIASQMKKIADDVGGKFFFENQSCVIRLVRNEIPLSLRYSRGTIYVGSFKHGVWIEEPQQRSTTEDADWFGRGLKLIIDNFYNYKKPEPTGRRSVWTEQRVNVISGMISAHTMRIRHVNVQPGGVLVYSTGRNGWGSTRFYLQYAAQPDDTLNVELEFSVNNFEIKAVGSYAANQTNQSIATDILRQLQTQAEKDVQKGEITSVAALAKVTGLRL